MADAFLRELKAKKQRELVVGVNNAENAFHHLKSYHIPDLQPTHDMINAATQQSIARRKQLQKSWELPAAEEGAEDGKEDLAAQGVKLPAIYDTGPPLSVKLNEGLRNIKDQKIRDLERASRKRNTDGQRVSKVAPPKKGEFQWMLAEEEQAPVSESLVNAQKRSMQKYKQWKREQAEQKKPFYEDSKLTHSTTCYWCRRLDKWCGWCHLPNIYVDPKTGRYATEGHDSWLRRPMSRQSKTALLGKAGQKIPGRKGGKANGERSVSSLGRLESQEFGLDDPDVPETQQQARARARQMAAVSKEKIFEVMQHRKPVLFRMLTDSELLALSEMVTIRRFAAHEVVVKQGDETTSFTIEKKDHYGNVSVIIGPAMYIALDGVFSVEVNYNSARGEQEEEEALFAKAKSTVSRTYSAEKEPPVDPNVEHVAQLTRGDAFGEFSLLTGCRRCCTVRASLPAAAIEVFRSDISAVLTRRKEVEQAKSHMVANVKKAAGVVSAIQNEVDVEKRNKAQQQKAETMEKFHTKAEMKVFGIALTPLQREREWQSGLNARRLKKLWREWMRDTYCRVIQRFFRVKIGTRRLHRITEARLRRVRCAKHVQRVIRGFLGRRAMLKELKRQRKPAVDFRQVNQRRHAEIRKARHLAALREREEEQWRRDQEAEAGFYAAFKEYVRAQKVVHCREILNSIVSGSLLGFSFLTICDNVRVPEVALRRWMHKVDVVHKRKEKEGDEAFERRKRKVDGQVEEAVISWYERNPLILKLVGDWRNDLAGHEKEEKDQKERPRKFTKIKIDNMKSLQQILHALKTEERLALGLPTKVASVNSVSLQLEAEVSVSDEEGDFPCSEGADRGACAEAESEEEESNDEEAEDREEVMRRKRAAAGWERARRGFAMVRKRSLVEREETEAQALARKQKEEEEAQRRGKGRERMLAALGERIRKANAGFGVRLLFESLDKDADGKVTREEMVNGFNVLKVELNLLEVNETIAHLDPDHTGAVPVAELVKQLAVAEHASTMGVELSEGGGFKGLVLASERVSEQELGEMTPSWDPLHGPGEEESSDDEHEDEGAERTQTFALISDLAADLYSIVFTDWTDLDLAIMRDKVRCRILYEIGPFLLPTGETHQWKTFKRMTTVLRTIRQGLWQELLQEIVNWDLALTPIGRLEHHISKVKKQIGAIAAGQSKSIVDVEKVKAELHQTLPVDPDTIQPGSAEDDGGRAWTAAMAALSPALQQMVRRVKEHTKKGGGAGLAAMRQPGKGKDGVRKLGRKNKGKQKAAEGIDEASPELPPNLVALRDSLVAQLADAAAAENLRTERGRMTLENFFNAVWGIRSLDHWVEGIAPLYNHRAHILASERVESHK